jgi:uncharacterized membrane protein (DUF485 family)
MSPTEPPFADGLPVIARRIVPDKRHAAIPPNTEALLVRNGAPEHVLASGRHTVRSFFQATPELYCFGVDSYGLPLWLTSLTTADGRSVALGWRISIQVADARRLWEGWLRHRPDEWISVPAELVSARLADPAQILVQRYTLDDLRSDPAVRREVAGKLSLLIKQQLDLLGLEFAEQFDAAQLRFLSDADRAAAARERAALQRVLADERLNAELNRLDNVDTLAWRLSEAAGAAGETLQPATARDLAQAALGLQGLKAGAGVHSVLAAPAAPETFANPPQLPAIEHRGRHHVFRRLSLLVLLVTMLAALTLAVITVLRPDLMATEMQRNQMIAGVVGVALLGVLVAWVIDQLIRWEAQRTAERMLLEANLDSPDEVNDRIELRHILTLVGALAGVAVTAAALWLPDHVNWVRVVGTAVGLLTAALAIRIDWLHNINRANQTMTSAQRRIAGANLGAAQRRRNHVKLQATLSAELEIVRRQLDTAASLAYRTLNDRTLNRRLRALESSVKQELRQVHDLEEAPAQRQPAEWDDVDQHVKRLRDTVQEAGRAAAHLSTQVQQGKNAGILSSVDNLEQIIRNLGAELARWTAIAA